MSVIIGLIISILLYKVFKKPKKIINNTDFYLEQEREKNEFIKRLMREDNTMRKELFSSKTIIDDNIIDIANQGENISYDTAINSESNILVPYWGFKYIYSYDEINNANKEQKAFYEYFKDSFYKKKYIDLKGINNYAFILLFDILNEYDNHKDVERLGNNLVRLGELYPKTEPYTESFFLKKIQNQPLVNDIHLKNNDDSIHINNSYSSWKFGDKYQYILNLNKDDIRLLNNLSCSSTSFIRIESCFIEVLKLYMKVINTLKKYYKSQSTTITKIFNELANKRYNCVYKEQAISYYDDKYTKQYFVTDLYTEIFRHCENYIREAYNYKRKLAINSDYPYTDIKDEFYEKILSHVVLVLQNYKPYVSPPSEEAEIELNKQNTTRWKIKYDEIKAAYNGDSIFFKDSILQLALLNKENPSLENIYFEAAKFIATQDKETALILYVHYIHSDLNSDTVNNKQLSKTIMKQLFQQQEELLAFEKIVQELTLNKDLNKAIDSILNLKHLSRKKIKLNISTIDTVIKEHASTVDLLNEYLKEEEHIDTIPQNLEIPTTATNTVNNNNKYLNDLELTHTQAQLLDLFIDNKLIIDKQQIEAFAKDQNLFTSQLIESINDKCYDTIDDILIEEEEDNYTINTDYFNQILQNDR